MFDRNLQGFKYPGITIHINRDVTYWEKRHSMNFSSVMEALGSALGLWMGLGVLQLGEKIEEIIIKIRKKVDV